MHAKSRVIAYGKRSATPRIEYCLLWPDDTFKAVSPRVWHAMKLPDMTRPSVIAQSAREAYLRATKGNLGKVVDDNRARREFVGPLMYNEWATQACALRGIVY